LVDRSRGRIGADQAHSKLVAMGYQGSERTTRRAVAEAKRRWRQEHGRRTRPWIPEPGLWLQWDYGAGPVVTASRTVLFCAWLAWSRYRVVVPLRDKTLGTVVIGLDRTLRRFDGVPTYALTDNEKTVTVEHVCGIAVRNPTIVEVSRHYGLMIATCEPADPQSKGGGSEATVRSRRPIWSRPITTCAMSIRTSRSWRRRASSSWPRSTPVRTGSRAGRRWRCSAAEHEHLHRLPRLPHTV
jgi:transposase